MKRTVFVITIIALASIVLATCGQAAKTSPQGRAIEVNGGSYRNITPREAKVMLEDKDFLFVNVHIPYEGEIPETDLFVPYDEIEKNLSRFPEDKGEKMVIYCRSGGMSATAANTLVQLGFTNVWDLDGGMRGWEGEGYELSGKPR